MTTVEEHKTELERKMAEAEKEERWKDLAMHAIAGAAKYRDWFVAAAYYQAAMIEIVGEKYPNDLLVQEAVRANRRVRVLADAQAA